MSWKALWAYAYPPPALLPQVLEKTQRDQCEIFLIATLWPRAMWFSLLFGILVQSPLRITNNYRLLWLATRLILPVVICFSQRLSHACLSTYLYTQPRGLIHHNLSNRRLHAWRVSGMLSASEAFWSTLHSMSVDPILTIANYHMAFASTLRATFGVEVGLKSLLWNIEMEQGQHQHHISSVESCLGFVSIDKTTFRTADPASNQLLTWKTVFLIAFASCKCRGEIHAFEHARL